MRQGDAITREWKPRLEANPADEEWAKHAEADDDDEEMAAAVLASTGTSNSGPVAAPYASEDMNHIASEAARRASVEKQAASVSWLEVRESWPFCLLCKKWATEEHLQSSRHKVREADPEDYLDDGTWDSGPPPPPRPRGLPRARELETGAAARGCGPSEEENS